MAGQVRVFWREYRCKACGRLQFKGYLPYGARVQVKCWHGQCRRVNVYKITEQGLEFTEELEDGGASNTTVRDKPGSKGRGREKVLAGNEHRNSEQPVDMQHRKRKVGAVAAE